MNVIVDPYWSKPTRCYNSFLFFFVFLVIYILMFAQAHLHINMYSLTIHLFIKKIIN